MSTLLADMRRSFDALVHPPRQYVEITVNPLGCGGFRVGQTIEIAGERLIVADIRPARDVS